MIIYYIIVSLYLCTCTLSEILWQSFYGSSAGEWSQTAGNSAVYDTYDTSCPYANTCWKLCASCCQSAHHVFSRNTFSTVGYTNMQLTFDMNTNSFSNSNYGSKEWCKIQWSSDEWTTSHDIVAWNDGNSGQTAYSPPGSPFSGAENQSNLTMRIYADVEWNSNGCCYFSRFTLAADPIPTRSPTQFPTQLTINPSANPTISPTKNPTISPTKFPTSSPSKSPIKNPSVSPTITTTNPSFAPTENTNNPTSFPTTFPSITPTMDPTQPQGVAGEETTQDGNNGVGNDNLHNNGGQKKKSLMVIVMILTVAFLLCICCILFAVTFKKKNKKKNQKKNGETNVKIEMEMANSKSNMTIAMHQIDSTSHVIPTVSPVPSQNDQNQHEFEDTLMDDVINAVNGVTDDGSGMNGLNQMNDDEDDDDDAILNDINTYKTGGGPLSNDENEVKDGTGPEGTPSDHVGVLDDVVVNNGAYLTKGADQDYDV